MQIECIPLKFFCIRGVLIAFIILVALSEEYALRAGSSTNNGYSRSLFNSHGRTSRQGNMLQNGFCCLNNSIDPYNQRPILIRAFQVRGLLLATLLVWVPMFVQAQPYDLLIRGGHVIDPANGIDQTMDLAIRDGKVAMVAEQIPASDAEQVIDAFGLYVTPGLIDVHAHVFVGNEPGRFADGFNSVSPDGFTFRNGITTVVDPGSAGWRTIDAFRRQVIEPSQTRILAFINLVGYGLYGTEYNNDLRDMDPERTLQAIREHDDLIVGVRFGHYAGPDYLEPLDQALLVAGTAGLPFLLVGNLPHLDVETVLARMRPGDQFTHSYEPGRRSLLDGNGRVLDAVWKARERGVLFDVGHGGASFRFSQAIPSVEQGFWPDTFGTDLHRYSMNRGMKDMLNVMSKFLNMGLPLNEVIERATWRSARSIQREDLGHLGEGAPADVAILRVKQGAFGYIDSGNFRMDGERKLVTELTLREGQVVWDLNGLASPPWDENASNDRSN